MSVLIEGNATLVEFGTGHVVVGPRQNRDSTVENTMVILPIENAGVIGEHSPEYEHLNLEEVQHYIALIFHKSKSVGVVIDILKQIKSDLEKHEQEIMPRHGCSG